jgi:hypothetical protein
VKCGDRIILLNPTTHLPQTRRDFGNTRVLCFFETLSKSFTAALGARSTLAAMTWSPWRSSGTATCWYRSRNARPLARRTHLATKRIGLRAEHFNFTPRTDSPRFNIHKLEGPSNPRLGNLHRPCSSFAVGDALKNPIYLE